MGFSITWCAVRDGNAQKVLDQLGLSPTGEAEDVPESLISTATLDTGWRIIWYNEYGCPFLRPEDLGVISDGQEVLMCLVEEHVMASSSELWRGGTRQWWISHEGEDGPKGLRPKETCRTASRRSGVKWRTLSSRQVGTLLASTTSSTFR